MDHNRIKVLLQRYRAGEATLQEQRLLENWYARESMYQMQNPEMEDYVRIKNEMWASLDRRLLVQKKVMRLWPRIAVAAYRSKFGTSLIAAAAVAAVVFGVWFYSSRQESRLLVPRNDNVVVNDIAPGKNGATITLGNGQVIQLSGQKTGVIVGKDLKYNDNTPLSPQGGSLPEGERSMMLTAQTSRGQTYQFTLPDGTKVWLNADSKISFPSQFNGVDRKVLLSGEAYFAVKHNIKQPFRVASMGQVVEDIGTEFNINAYDDEQSIKTTLVQGSARVLAIPHHDKFSHAPGNMSYGNEEGTEPNVILDPGQQAVLKGLHIGVKQVNTEEAVAWKNGLFRFNDEKISSIMKKLERWYNIEVVYEGEPSPEGFTGKISRNNNISEVLMMLQQTKGVKFKVAGRRVTIIR